MTKQDVLFLLNADEIGSDAEKKLERILKSYRDEDVSAVVCDYAKNKDVSLSILFIPSYFETKLESIRMKEKLEEMQKKMPAENETAKALDVLSSALVETMRQTKGDDLLKAMKEDLDAYAKEKYHVTQKPIEFINVANGRKAEGIVHEEFENIIDDLSCGFNVMMIGPAGSGKNVLAKQIADFLGWEYFQANAVQYTYNLDGFIDANGKYQRTEFYKACKTASEGKDVLFLFDEIDGSNAEVLVRFNDALSSFKLEFPTEVIDFKDHMHFMAAANTFGTGASFEYVGRNQLDAATLDRWANVEINYDPRVEEIICPDNPELLEFYRAFRNSVVKNHLLHIVSYRGLERCYKKFLKVENRTAKNLRKCLTKNMEPNDLSMIVRDLPRSIYKDMVEELINA